MSELKAKKKKSITIIIISVLVALLLVGVGIFVFSRVAKTARINKELAAAEKFYEEMDYESAYITYTGIIKIDPKCVEAYIGLGDVIIAMENPSYYVYAIEVLENGYEQTGNPKITEKIEEIKAVIQTQDVYYEWKMDISALSVGRDKGVGKFWFTIRPIYINRERADQCLELGLKYLDELDEDDEKYQLCYDLMLNFLRYNCLTYSSEWADFLSKYMECDENGMYVIVESESNDNNFVYTFTYNEKGQLISTNTDHLNGIWEYCEYSYSSDGMLDEYKQLRYWNDFVEAVLHKCEYDGDGRLVRYSEDRYSTNDMDKRSYDEVVELVNEHVIYYSFDYTYSYDGLEVTADRTYYHCGYDRGVAHGESSSQKTLTKVYDEYGHLVYDEDYLTIGDNVSISEYTYEYVGDKWNYYWRIVEE